MHFIDKREKNMNQKEKLQLEIARTLVAARGADLRNRSIDYNFRSTSNSMKMAKAVLDRFEVDYKDEKEAKMNWPEREIHCDDNSPEKEEPKKEEKREDKNVEDRDEQEESTKKNAKKNKIEEDI